MQRYAIFFAMLTPLVAQVQPFNAAGVTMGHHHIMVKDVAAQKKVWVDALGGQLSGNAPLEFVKFPGTFLIISSGNTTQGMAGSTLDHFAFAVKDYKATRDKLVAAGVKILEEEGTELMAELPDGIRVEFFEDKALKTPLEHRAMHLMVADADAERAWWEKAFGAETKVNGDRKSTSIPGAGLHLQKVDAARAKTQGRSLDHTGIGVKNVGEYCTKLEGLGIMCERAAGGNIAMVTSPAGVRVEINQGLENR